VKVVVNTAELTKPCDIFNDWIDSCDAENRGEYYGDDHYEEEYEEAQEYYEGEDDEEGL
jgi:transcription elongation factor Elf1